MTDDGATDRAGVQRIEPAAGFTNPERTLKKVVFPAPFGPMRLTIAPRGTAKSMPLTAWTVASRLTTARSCSPFIS